MQSLIIIQFSFERDINPLQLYLFDSFLFSFLHGVRNFIRYFCEFILLGLTPSHAKRNYFEANKY